MQRPYGLHVQPSAYTTKDRGLSMPKRSPYGRYTRDCASRRLSAATSPGQEYTGKDYIGSDGRRKYTWEEVFTSTDEVDADADGSTGQEPPWVMIHQSSEKRLNLDESLRTRLQRRLVAEHLELSEDVTEQRLNELGMLLPGSADKLLRMKPQLVASLLENLPEIASKLVILKATFPTANVAQMISRQPALVLTDQFGKLEEAGRQLDAILPGVDVDRLVEEHPSALDIASFEQAVNEAKRIMPDLDVARVISTNPSMIFSFQRGNNLIPYDGVNDDPD